MSNRLNYLNPARRVRPTPPPKLTDLQKEVLQELSDVRDFRLAVNGSDVRMLDIKDGYLFGEQVCPVTTVHSLEKKGCVIKGSLYKAHNRQWQMYEIVDMGRAILVANGGL